MPAVSTSKRERANADRFNQRYTEGHAKASPSMAFEVFGANIDVNGYTTVAQAEDLARELKLHPGMRLLDVGAGAGWPGLHIAEVTGCDVVLADQPRPALQRAMRHARDGSSDAQSTVVQMTATAFPFTPATFDGIVHTDVMCCLGNKVSVLKAMRRLLKPGGRMAFITIHTPPDLDTTGKRLAHRHGPRMVNSRLEYPIMLGRAGFANIRGTDITKDYLKVSRAWREARAKHRDELRAAFGDARACEMECDSRLNVEGVVKGLLRRSLFVAVK
jgi:cyclopropane fatty-acyl-phospholipid synthase-like methyltransferase